MKKYFMHRIKAENDSFDKGIEVHDSFEKALSSYHAYLGAYAYDNPKQPNVTFVFCMISDMDGMIHRNELWVRPEEEESSESEV